MACNPIMSAPEAATNRESYITLQALLYAVARIQTLPEDQQEYSNMANMCALARRVGGQELAFILWGVEHHVGHEINLWPADHGDEPDNHYTDEEVDHQNAVRSQINAWKARFEETGALLDAPSSDVIKFLGSADDQGEAA